jgi:hypothetical protein
LPTIIGKLDLRACVHVAQQDESEFVGIVKVEPDDGDVARRKRGLPPRHAGRGEGREQQREAEDRCRETGV